MWLNKIKIVEQIFSKKSSVGKSFEYKRKKQVAILKCDNCHNIFERDIHNLSKSRRNNDYKHFCNECDYRALAGKMAGEIRNKRLESQIGKIIKSKGGYKEVYVNRTHPYRPNQNWVREHIIIVENHIGRKLKENEVVHHIDGDKDNNNISNLDVCTVSEHNNCHAKAEKIVFELYKQGKVLYDNVKKRYYLP